MRLLLSLVLAAATPMLCAADGAPDANADTANRMRGHVEFLAHDLLEGRETGTRGHEIAAEYVASQLKSLGLVPAGTQGWFQRIPFTGALLDDSKSRFSIDGVTYENRKEILFGPARKAGDDRVEADIVFVGYGIDDPAAGQNDYARLDVKGKVVAVLTGFPKGMPSDVGAHYGRSKAKMAQARGAVGLINIRTRERERTRPWTREIEGPVHPTISWAQEDGTAFAEAPAISFTATLHDKAATALFADSRSSLAQLLAIADQTGGRPKGFALRKKVTVERSTSLSTLTSPNVIGMLPGSDPALAGEYVLLMGHLDHIGIDPKREGDKIFNGAMDNASGVAAMIEAARALASSPTRPKRPILFAAVTAEERGLLGSDYLARHPVIKNGRIVAVVNLDMPILLYDFRDVIAFGAEHSTMGPAVARAAETMGIKLSPDPLPSEGLFTRSDHYSFVKQGVPSLFLITGFDNGGATIFADFLKTHYHKASDEPALPFNWTAAARFAQINMRIASEIANGAQAPLWYQGSFFGKVFAPSAIKAPPPQ